MNATFEIDQEVLYTGPYFKGLDIHNKTMRIVKKYDNGLKNYPTFLWVVFYRGYERLIMEQDLHIKKVEE